MTRFNVMVEEIVEYWLQLLVEADNEEEAVELAKEEYFDRQRVFNNSSLTHSFEVTIDELPENAEDAVDE